jgi:glycosyltransferase involved in cell wall biosynthesis
MIKICMITHDQLEKQHPKADLIRFKCLGESLVKNSIEVVYVASNENTRFEEGFYKGAKVYKIPFVTQIRIIQVFCFYLFLFPLLLRIRQHGRFDIIFVNSVLTVPCALMFKWMCGNGCIQFDLMGILSEEKFLRLPKNLWFRITKKLFSSFENILLSHVDFITTINDQHRQILLKRTSRPVYVIRDGVFESILEQPAYLTKDSGDRSKMIIIFVGQVNHFRLDPLFKVLPELIAELPNFQLLVLGAGSQLARYKEMVKLLGLEEQVTFYGYIPHEKIFDYIASADIAYSDDWSVIGFPMKLYDYMALGKAIVAEGTESVKEVLIDRVNGLLYTNEAELKEKILELAKDVSMRRKLGEAARRMMDQHTWEKSVEVLRLIYKQFIRRMETT